jgi:mRNA deadenylase 3'-5' endonuclease subunit Ccr4
MVRIVTYNILSVSLATKFHFTSTNTKYLKPDNRWTLLQKQLLEEIGKTSIICLQEVCLFWLEKLIPFFQTNKYKCHYNNYGWTGSGHMGILIAYPKIYTLTSLKMVNVGEYIESRVTPIKEEKSLDDVWFKAIKKRNTLLCLKLKYNDKIFTIGTYHMPCTIDSIKLLHLISVIQLINKIAENTKFILTGDFNFMPNTLLYKVITEGGNYSNNIEKSVNYDTTMMSLKVPTIMKSAYGSFDKEPLFTNYAQTGNNELFSGCLDYVFVSRGWTVNDVKKLPSNLPELTYPSLGEPSDHLMLAVKLEMVERVKKI